jgi:hypothetical protein
MICYYGVPLSLFLSDLSRIIATCDGAGSNIYSPWSLVEKESSDQLDDLVGA